METPLITTIIPTFRRPQLLRRAIASALRQTFGNLQVCVYDNASGDETADVVSEFARRDPRVKYHCHSENIGGGANFNFALARVDTPYFSFLSDDDVLLPEFYEIALAGFRAYPDAGFSAGSTIVMTDKGEVLTVPLDNWSREGCFSPPDGFLQLIYNKLPVWTSILFRKQVTDKVGLLDLEIGSPGDFDYQLQVACRSPFVISKKTCAIYVSHVESFSAGADIPAFWPGWLRLTRNITENSDIPEDIRAQAERGLALHIKKVLFSVGLRIIRDRNFASAHLASDVLRRHLKDKIRSFFLSTAARICESGEFPRNVFASAYDLALSIRSMLHRDRAQLQEKYGEYAKWL